MPLAAVIIPGPAPGAQTVRTDGAAAPDRIGGAGAFDALLTGGAADDRLRQQLMNGSAPRSEWRVGAMPSPRIVPGGQAGPVDGSPGFQDPDMAGTPVKGAPGMSPDSSPVEPGAEDPIRLTKGMPGRDLDSSPVEPGEEEPGRPVKGAPRPSLDASPGQMDELPPGAPVKGAPGPDSSPVEPDQGELGVEAKGAPRQILDSSPVEPGGETPFKTVKDQQRPAVDASPGQIDPEQPGAPGKGAPGPDSSPVMPGDPAPGGAASPALQTAAPEREALASDETETGIDAEAETGSDLKAGAQTPAPAPGPEQPVPSNAAPVRREADSRRSAPGAEAGKAGDEAVKPAQSGAKAQAAPPAPAATAAQSGAPDMPAAARSADAFQALLQAQTRPGGETAPARAADLALDPSGDAGLRSAPDRAAETLRTPSMTQAGASPRFAAQTVQTLAAQIVRRQSEGGRVFDIRLDPPELGRVGVRLEMGKDQLVKAMLSAERPDTLHELQRTARDLERALAEAGLTLAENGLSFSLGGERGERDTPGLETPRGARSVVDIDVARPGAPVTALYGFALARAAGLDIQA